MSSRSKRPEPAGPRSVSSSSLAPLLTDLGISLIVTTYQSGHAIVVRAEDTETVNTHFVRLPQPMGVAAGPDRIAIGSPSAVTEFHDHPEIGQFLPRRTHYTGNIRMHEIAYAGEELWIVNTAFSALCTLDGVHSFVPRWRPPFISALAAEDRCHLNGVAIDEGRVRTVTAFSETDTASGWRDRIGPHGVAIDVASGETVVRGLSLPHSPRWHAGELWLLNSGQGTLARADLAKGRAETFAELPGFTRGLALLGPFAFIGLSQVRDHDAFRGMEMLERVPEPSSGVWVVDLRDGSTAAYLRFESAVREIFDVKVLPGIRRPLLFAPGSPMNEHLFVLPE